VRSLIFDNSRRSTRSRPEPELGRRSARLNHFQPIVEDEVDPILQVRRYEEEQARKRIEREAMELDDNESDVAEPEQETQEYDPEAEEGSQGVEKTASESEGEEQGSASEASEGDHMEVDDADTGVEGANVQVGDQASTLATQTLLIASDPIDGPPSRPANQEVLDQVDLVQDAHVPVSWQKKSPFAMATANGPLTPPFREEVKERASAIQDDDEVIPDSQPPATKDQTRFLSDQEDSTVTSPSSE
jgi:hypothetical protein